MGVTSTAALVLVLLIEAFLETKIHLTQSILLAGYSENGETPAFFAACNGILSTRSDTLASLLIETREAFACFAAFSP